ncbi:MAG: tyrosine-type recombinase/integrase [Lentihominibacter sp.]|nr:site-specific integrase [Lentihominibacter sp.]
MAKTKRTTYGSGSFRKRNNKYEYRVSFKDETGKLRYKSFTAKTKGGCYQRAEQFFLELERTKKGISAGDTIPKIMKDKYENDFQMNFIAEQGYSRNLEHLKILESYPIADKPIYEITVEDIEAYLRSIVHYSNSVIGKLYLQLKQAFKEGVRRGYITENLIEIHDIRKPNSNKTTKKVRGLTEAEQQAFVKALEEYRVPSHGQNYKQQLLIELYTGMRMGEINALAPSDVDFARNIIHVHKTVSRGLDSRSFISDTAKTEAGNRYVPINNMVRPILQEAIKDMKKNTDGVIFYDHRGKKLVDTAQVCSYFNRVCAKAGINITGQHCLRHTCATRCIEAGISAVVLKSWLGHTDIHVTLDTYSDVFDRLNHKSIEQYENYMATNQF